MVLILLGLGPGAAGCRAPEPAQPADPLQGQAPRTQAPPELALPAGYAGSAACAACHADIFRSWQGSVHAANMAPAVLGVVLGDFERKNEYTFAGTRSRLFRDGDRYFLEYTGADGKTGTYSIDYVLGTVLHQNLLHREEDGRLQVLPTHWNVLEGAWRDDREGAVTSGPVPLPPDHPYYWRGYGRTFNRACMECHAGVARKRFDPQTLRYASIFDPAVGCEACHGPAAQHVQVQQLSAAAAGASPPPSPTPTSGPGGSALHDTDGLPDLRRLGAAASIEICTACHARKLVFQEGYRPGEPAADYFVPDVWEEGQFWVDGRSGSVDNYTWVEFLQSACVRRSSEPLDCTGCHPPHASRAVGERGPEEQDAPCTRCHVVYAGAPTAHTFHPSDSRGSRCVGCHMPVRTMMGMELHDHTIGIPLPELTLRYRVANACNDCHADDTPEWAERFVQEWYGQSPTFQAYRARLLERAEILASIFSRVGPLPVDALARWLDDPALPVVQRASAARFLGQAAPDRRALEALLRHRRDADPVVAFHAVAALGGFAEARDALFDSLGDRRRTIRVQAYQNLLGLDPAIAQDAAPRVARAREEHRIRQEVVLADDPRAAGRLARQHLAAGRQAEAELALRRAVAMTAPALTFRVDLLQLLRTTGRQEEAEAELRLIEAADPGLGGVLRAQGLLAAGRPAEALQLLGRLRRAGLDSPQLRGLTERAMMMVERAKQ